MNSKRAHELWRTKKLDALNACLSVYQKKLEAYKAREAKIDQENTLARVEWLDKIQERANFEEEVRKILDAERVPV